MSDSIDRRKFLEKSVLVAGAAGAIARARGRPQAQAPALNSTAGLVAKPVRLGFIGVGIRGTLLMEAAAGISGVEIVAVADCYKRPPRSCARAGHPRPAHDGRLPTLLARPDVDAVVIVDARPLAPPDAATLSLPASTSTARSR